MKTTRLKKLQPEIRNDEWLSAIGVFVILLCTYAESITQSRCCITRHQPIYRENPTPEENHNREDSWVKLNEVWWFDDNFVFSKLDGFRHTDQKGVFLGLQETGSLESMDSTCLNKDQCNRRLAKSGVTIAPRVRNLTHCGWGGAYGLMQPMVYSDSKRHNTRAVLSPSQQQSWRKCPTSCLVTSLTKETRCQPGAQFRQQNFERQWNSDVWPRVGWSSLGKLAVDALTQHAHASPASDQPEGQNERGSYAGQSGLIEAGL